MVRIGYSKSSKSKISITRMEWCYLGNIFGSKLSLSGITCKNQFSFGFTCSYAQRTPYTNFWSILVLLRHRHPTHFSIPNRYNSRIRWSFQKCIPNNIYIIHQGLLIQKDLHVGLDGIRILQLYKLLSGLPVELAMGHSQPVLVRLHSNQ